MFIDAWSVLYALWAFIMVFCLTRMLEDIRKSTKEYAACWKVERERKKRLPAKLRALSKEQIELIMPYLCMYFFVPNIDKMEFGLFVCSKFSHAGECIMNMESRKVTMRLKGWRKFPTDVFLHELTHHLEYMTSGNSSHDEIFVRNLDKAFDAFEQLNGLK